MNEFDGFGGAAFGMFMQTGQIGYYLLSKRLKEEDLPREEDERLR